MVGSLISIAMKPIITRRLTSAVKIQLMINPATIDPALNLVRTPLPPQPAFLSWPLLFFPPIFLHIHS
jgi:hypothetical protein